MRTEGTGSGKLKRRAGGSAPVAPLSPSGTGPAECSQRQDEVRQLHGIAEAAPELRSARIEEVSEELADGSHPVQAETVAEAILEDGLERGRIEHG